MRAAVAATVTPLARGLLSPHHGPGISISVRTKVKSSASYCLNLVKNHDYENFVSTILLRDPARASALAIRSFNVEVARIPEQVQQKSIGLMRLQFWDDTLKCCFSEGAKKVPEHPVAAELFKAINHAKLSKRYLNNLLNCRRDRFGVSSFNTMEDMEKYCEQSVSNVYYLILEACGVRNVHADHAASHLGKAQGIVQYLRTLPHAKSLNLVAIPQDVLIKHGVSQEEVIRGRSSKALGDCAYAVASTAHQHLVKSRSLKEQVPESGRAAFLPAVATSSFLDRLQKADYDVFHPRLKHRSWSLLPQLWMAQLKNTY